MLVGLALVYLTGFAQLDSVLAALVALNILWSGWGVIRESVGGLMDVAVPADTQKVIREVIATNAEGAIEAHDIRTRQAGKMCRSPFMSSRKKRPSTPESLFSEHLAILLNTGQTLRMRTVITLFLALFASPALAEYWTP